MNLGATVLVLAIVLFVAAGTLAWQRAWVLVAVLLVVRTLSAIAVFRVNPFTGSQMGNFPQALTHLSHVAAQTAIDESDS